MLPRLAALPTALVALALLPAPGNAATRAKEAPLPSPGTKAMAQRLQDIIRAGDPMKNPFRNAERAAKARGHLAKATDVEDILRTRMMLGWELIAAGRTEEGIAELLAVRQGLQAPGLRPSPDSLKQLRELLVTGYLRLGEQQNCVMHHTGDSCLMPIRAGGVHGVPEGSRKAVAELTAALTEDPADLKARWLLNLACMTLGEWPAKVPPAWLIPESVFQSDVAFPRFPDVAGKAGLAEVGLSGSAILEDFDGDGHLDAMTSAYGLQSPMHFYHGAGDGTFEDRTAGSGLNGLVGGLNANHADYDNDGDEDVLVLRGAWLRDQGRYPDSLLRNRGNGTFDDVTEEAGLLAFHPGQVGAWADFDGDGRLDLFMGYESTEGDPHPCELWRNDGDGTFTNVAAKAGVANVGFVKGAAWGDYDNDGRPDLYLSRLNQANVLYRSNGPGADGAWTFTDVTAKAGVAQPMKSFPTWFWDYDNDGWLDIFVASYSQFQQDSLASVAKGMLGMPVTADTPHLYRNRRDGTFEDVTKAAGLDDVLLVMGANYGDLDNDGFPDCYLTTGDPYLTTLVPNRMYRNDGGRRFQDVTTAGGFGHVQKGHGVAFGDVDGDGDQDVFHKLGGAYEGDTYRAALFENPGFGRHWITLRLRGTKANRSGLGARLRLTITENGKDRDVHALVSDGGSFGSSSIQQEIGLGSATALKAVEIRWPGSGTVDRFTDVKMDAVYRAVEGAKALERVR